MMGEFLSVERRGKIAILTMIKPESMNAIGTHADCDDIVDTLRALEAGIESFPGCVVVISHDRWFLDRIATHILAFEGDSQVRFFEGNVSDYEAFRHKELGAADRWRYIAELNNLDNPFDLRPGQTLAIAPLH